eukprot:scaffold29273_cov250-Skeletonema_marinoi.AAC.2
MPYPYPILDRDLWPKRGAAPHVKNVVCNGRAQKKTLTKILAKFVSRIAKMKSNGPAVEYSCFSTIGCLSRDGPSSEMRCCDHDVVKTCWADYPPTAPPAPSQGHKYGRGGHGVLLRAIRT